MMHVHRVFACLSLSLSVAALVGADGLGWHFVQNGTSGIIALEAVVVSPTLAVLFDRIDNHDPLQLNGQSVWGALWNFETNKATPLKLITDSFCASGSMLSNGTMVSIGGNPPSDPQGVDGRNGLRIFEPCEDPAGEGCTVFENPKTHHIARYRWYPTSLRIPDGSVMIIGGNNVNTSFYSDNSETSFEFFPPKDGGIPRESPFLVRAGRSNLFPRAFSLPDGTVFIIANNQSIIYDLEKKTETILPDVPGGVRVTNPFDGTATLLPLSPPNYIPEVLVCGGHITTTDIEVGNRSSQDRATDQCSRIVLTPEGIKRGWELDRMLEPRSLHQMILLPNGQVVITNGGRSGYAGWDSVSDPVGLNSNADHPALTPSLYTPSSPLGKRFSNTRMPTTDIPRLYHSTATLTPMGNIFIGGSNPNPGIINGTEFQSELRIEYLNPPYMTLSRPRILSLPSQISFNHELTVEVSIPNNLKAEKIQGKAWFTDVLNNPADTVFAIFLTARLSSNRKELTIRSPPNNRVFPPGPGFIFLTIDDVTSTGTRVMMGNGATPPVEDQGVGI